MPNSVWQENMQKQPYNEQSLICNDGKSSGPELYEY